MIDTLQEHPQDYWQDADEDFWEDPVSSPDKVNASPAVSPAKEPAAAVQHPPAETGSQAQQEAAPRKDAVSPGKPAFLAVLEAEAERQKVTGERMSACQIAEEDSRQDALEVGDIVSETKPAHQSITGGELRKQQDTSIPGGAMDMAKPDTQLAVELEVIAPTSVMMCASQIPQAHSQHVNFGRDGSASTAKPNKQAMTGLEQGSPPSDANVSSGRTTQVDSQQDAAEEERIVSMPEPGHQAAAASEHSDASDVPVSARQTAQQDAVQVEHIVSQIEPAHQSAVGGELEKQPSGVPVSFPMIAHAGAVARSPSRQTSSEFLASIAGIPHSTRWVRPTDSFDIKS